VKVVAKLSYQQRKKLPGKTFVFPAKRAYPIPDASHGRNALARVSQFGSPTEKAKVKAAVHAKFPGIGKASPSEKQAFAKKQRGWQ
jgi:hypothetical protein